MKYLPLLLLCACLATTPGSSTPAEPALVVEPAPDDSAPAWVLELVQTLGTVVLTYLGLRRVPNRWILGTELDPEVARVAGVKS